MKYSKDKAAAMCIAQSIAKNPQFNERADCRRAFFYRTGKKIAHFGRSCRLFETAQKYYPEIKENIITVSAFDGRADEAIEEVTNLLRQRRAVPNDQPNNFGVNRAEQIFALVGDIINGLNLISVTVALASLLIGGVGVMNIGYGRDKGKNSHFGLTMF